MILRLQNLRLPVGANIPLSEAAAAKLGISPSFIVDLEIRRKALDARRKNQLFFVYTVDLHFHDYFPRKEIRRLLLNKDVQPVEKEQPFTLAIGERPLSHRPVVIGAGPAGFFAALLLAEYGYMPIVLERGKKVEERIRDVNEFWQGGKFRPDSNVQFGEGGAGTFSDGKLTTRINDCRIGKVMQTFVEMGAPPEILYLHKPHIGTDKLREVVRNLRERIISLGGEIRFQQQVTDLFFENRKLVALQVNGKEELPCSAAILAVGHSARDTYEMLYRRGICLNPKPFSIGVRIEHSQKTIDRAQYGRFAGHPDLGPADYQLVYKDEENGRTAYSFCMCPGGTVVAAASEIGGVVTNGMSEYARDKANANSALAVTVGPEDYGEGPLDGVKFQRKWEQAAFEVGGKTYAAPIQRIGDFLIGEVHSIPEDAPVQPTYRPAVTPADLRRCLPDFVTETLARAILALDRKLKGFADPNGLLTGVETRTSAPLRIVRGEDGQAVGFAGLYPAGEGAGYAGGIVSAAVDGLRIAEKLIATYRRPSK